MRAAEALAEEINLRKGYRAVLYDGLEETRWGYKTKPEFMFYLLSHYFLFIFNFFYRLTDNLYGLLVLRKLIKLIWGYSFRRTIEKVRPDLIISTHHFISPSTISSLSQKIPFKIAVVDLGKPHRIWFDNRADAILVPDDKMKEWAVKKFGIDEGKIEAIGYPLKKHFRNYSPFKRSNEILIMGAGISPKIMKGWVKKINSSLPDKKITVICGHNRRLYQTLTQIGGINTFSFVDNMHDFLYKADLVISKAGPGIIMEATALRKPIIVVKAVGLQEHGNIDFVVSNHLGLYDKGGKNIVSSILEIYRNYPKYTQNNSLISFEIEKIINHLLKV